MRVPPPVVRWIIFASLLVGIGVVVAVKRKTPVAAATASSEAPKDSAAPPEDMFWWVHDALERSGIRDQDSLHLVRSGGRWVADFRNLPLWSLPQEDRAFMIARVFPDSIRIDGASLCAELPREIGVWLDRVSPGWKGKQRCSGQDEEEILQKWLAEVEGKVSLVHQKRDGNGKVVRLGLACKNTMKDFPLGRLLPLRSLESLELDGCRLEETQSLFEFLPVKRLVIRNARERRLNLFAMRGLDTLRVEGGRLAWLDVPQGCPIGRDTCPREEQLIPREIRLSKIPVCAPGLVASLDSMGVDREEMRCDGYPTEFVSTVEGLVEEFHRQTDKSEFIQPFLDAKPLSQRVRQFKIPRKIDWVDVAPGEFSCTRSDAFTADSLPMGEDWLVKPTVGAFFMGKENRPSKYAPEIGDSRLAIAQSLPQPLATTKDFRVYADPKGSVELILHLDGDGLLDAIWYPQGCWAESWVRQFLEDHPYIEEGE